MAAFEKPCPKLLPGPQSPPTSPKKGGVWNYTKHCLIKCDVGLLILSSVSWMVFHQESSMNAQCIFSYRTSLTPIIDVFEGGRGGISDPNFIIAL